MLKRGDWVAKYSLAVVLKLSLRADNEIPERLIFTKIAM